MNTSLIDLLRELETKVWAHEDDFLTMFCPTGVCPELIELTFSSENCKFVYLVDSGQHVVNTTPMATLYKWLNKFER